MEQKMSGGSSGGEVATNGINGSFKPVEDIPPQNHEYHSPPKEETQQNPGLTFKIYWYQWVDINYIHLISI